MDRFFLPLIVKQSLAKENDFDSGQTSYAITPHRVTSLLVHFIAKIEESETWRTQSYIKQFYHACHYSPLAMATGRGRRRGSHSPQRPAHPHPRLIPFLGQTRTGAHPHPPVIPFLGQTRTGRGCSRFGLRIPVRQTFDPVWPNKNNINFIISKTQTQNF